MNDKPALDAPRPIIGAGTQLNSLYEIDAPIATGGMGEVYRGHAIQTGDLVAIKLIRSDLAEAEAAFALFRKEAAALHNLYHEAIVRYYVFTIDPLLGRPYLAMEFVDGPSLSALLQQGPLGCEAAHSLMVRVASGLQAAHAQGIIHRDISPDNIIIPDGDVKRAKIIDFGIARSTRLDSSGTIIGSGFAGKYNYVSPEQLGLFGGDVTPKSDIYSLALVLAEALRQRPLDMGGTHAEVIEKRRGVPNLSGLDIRLRPLLERMLQPDPQMRPASMAEVAAWSLPALPNAAVRPQKTAPPPPIIPVKPTRRIDPPRRLAPVKIFAAGLALASSIIVGFAAYIFLHEHSAEAPKQAAVQPVKDVGAHDDSPAPYLAHYDGGPCFFLTPLRATDKMAIAEGYGLSAEPFDELDDNFRRKFGFGATIGVHPVEHAQCPALTLLGQLRHASATPPKIQLKTTVFKLGQIFSGTIENSDGRNVDLLLVTNTGSVRRLATVGDATHNGELTFEARLEPGIANGKLQLLIALAGAQPLPLQIETEATAADVFARLSDAMAQDVDPSRAASLRSFRFDK